MKSLEEVVAEHLENNEIGHLKSLESQIAQVIDFVKPRAMAILSSRASTLDIEKKAASERNLAQAEKNFSLIVGAIYKLEGKHQ